MRRLALALIAVVAPLGCKNPEQQADDQRASQVKQAMADGRAAMAAHDFEGAAQHFGKATSLAPNEAMGFLMLAQAQRDSGNDAAAVMSIKHAEELGAKADPVVKRERAELYRRMGQVDAAIATLTEMRDANQLTDAELLMLAKMQARTGDTESA